MKTSSSRNHGSSLNASKPLIVAGCLAFGLMAQPAQAALTFNFNYLNPGEGFDDPTFGVERKAALNDAANTLGAYFSSYTASLEFDVNSYSDANAGVLASASSSTPLIPGTFQRTRVQSEIITGIDANGTRKDGTINWNFFYDWGLGDNVSSTQYDFKSTAIHELLHAFGFLSYVDANGMGLGNTGAGTADTWSIYDGFLADASGNWLIDNNAVFDTSKVGALTAGTANSSGVFFMGENALAATNGAGIPLYTPAPWSDGSSISHLDDNSDISNQSIMNAQAHGQGLDIRTLGALELAVLKDIGYTNVAAPAAVPVPSAVWLMLSGLLGVFGVNRQRKSA